MGADRPNCCILAAANELSAEGLGLEGNRANADLGGLACPTRNLCQGALGNALAKGSKVEGDRFL